MAAVVRGMGAAEARRRSPELVALMDRAAGGVDIGRVEIVRRHAGYPGVRGALAEVGGRLAGFCYACTSTLGQWWNGQVRSAVGDEVARAVLDGALEVVELHVDPAEQGRGLGRALLGRVAAGAGEPRAVLTTEAGNARARRFYAAAGFEVLHEGLWSRDGSAGAVVLLAPLPLPGVGVPSQGALGSDGRAGVPVRARHEARAGGEAATGDDPGRRGDRRPAQHRRPRPQPGGHPPARQAR